MFFFSPWKREKRGVLPHPPSDKFELRYNGETRWPHMPRRWRLQSSGALRDTCSLFSTYWSRCGSNFIGNVESNYHKRSTSTETNLRVFLWAPHVWKVGINVIIFILGVVDACRLWLLYYIKLFVALRPRITAGGRYKGAIRGAAEHVRVHDSDGSAWIH